ncbi:MAG: hypothetical protein GF353_14085 [Candidatus Lokiarchaeota archaeon]|nr:hypothetical protein [Candidatus Lokiarchaeota archaeon]
MIPVLFKPFNREEEICHRIKKTNKQEKENREEDINIIENDRKKKTNDLKILYVKMRLSTKKITPEFEASVKNQIEEKHLNVKIREAGEQDYPTVISIYKRAWMTSNTPISDLSSDLLRELNKSSKTKIFLAKVYGIDAGFVILDFEGEKNEIGFITALGILPRFQRRKVGTSLGIRTWKYFKKFNVKELRTEVYINNSNSKEFLKSLGFEEFDRFSYD